MPAIWQVAIRYNSKRKVNLRPTYIHCLGLQAWLYVAGRLRHGSWCLAPPTPAYVGAQVITLPCSSSNDQLWEKLERGQLRGVTVMHRVSNLCLDARNAQEITVQECNPQLDTQEFIFTRWESILSSMAKTRSMDFFLSYATIAHDPADTSVLVIDRWSSVFIDGAWNLCQTL